MFIPIPSGCASRSVSAMACIRPSGTLVIPPAIPSPIPSGRPVLLENRSSFSAQVLLAAALQDDAAERRSSTMS